MAPRLGILGASGTARKAAWGCAGSRRSPGRECYDCGVLPPLCTARMIELSVNGEMKRVPASIDVAGLLDVLTLTGKKVAVERNGEIVPRSLYNNTTLVQGDKLEIVVAVGGG